MLKTFPTSDVCRLLDISVPTQGDTYVSCEFTLADMTGLESIGALDLTERQNDSPTIGEFLSFFRAEEYKGLKFIGYVIFPPRSDARVGVEGFECRPTDDQKKILRQNFGRTDKFECRDNFFRALWN